MNKPSSLTLFSVFFRIGLFTLGGGYAMLPLIHREVVHRRGWMDDDTFTDGLAAAQTCPGPIAVNLSVYTGYHIAGRRGLALAVLGTVLPSFLIILIIALTYSNWVDSRIVSMAFRGLRPAVTALIAVPVVQIARKSRLKWYGYLVPLTAAILIVHFNISPIYPIVLTVLIAWSNHLRKSIRAQRKSI